MSSSAIALPTGLGKYLVGFVCGAVFFATLGPLKGQLPVLQDTRVAVPGVQDTRVTEAPPGVQDTRATHAHCVKLVPAGCPGGVCCFAQYHPTKSHGSSGRIHAEVNLLGVGPAKSGSSNMMSLLGRHPLVLVGNATMAGKKCCGPELYVLDNSTMVSHGASAYDSYFPSNTSRAKFLAEKTPQYSGHTCVPYRARAVLGSALRLIYTIRDPLQLEASLYLHRSKSNPTFNITYAAWSEGRLKIHKQWLQCRETEFQRMLVPSTWASLPDLVNKSVFAPESTHIVEEELYRSCGQGRFMDDAVNEIMNAASLRRWVHAFSRDQIKCFYMQDQQQKPAKVMSAVAHFLGIDADGFGELSESKSRPADAVFARLRTHQLNKFGPNAVKGVATMLNTVNTTLRNSITKEDEAFLTELCPRL